MTTIFFSLNPPNGSYGGGSFFVKDLAKYFIKNDYEITFELKPNIDLIFIIDPRQGPYKKYSLENFLQYKQYYPNTKILYAVNECDIKRQIPINIEPLIVKCILNCDLIVEGSNGPISDDAEKILKNREIPIIPDILCNSGGVVVSYFEWIQNISNESWTKEKVFDKLDNQMIDCFNKIKEMEDYDLYNLRNLCYQYSIQNIYNVYSLRKSYLFNK